MVADIKSSIFDMMVSPVSASDNPSLAIMKEAHYEELDKACVTLCHVIKCTTNITF